MNGSEREDKREREDEKSNLWKLSIHSNLGRVRKEK